MWQQKPWTYEAKVPFDFNDPLGRWAALLKSTQNLVGKRTYVSSYSRVYLTEVGKQSNFLWIDRILDVSERGSATRTISTIRTFA